jgi:hypothetical protein
MLRRPQKLCCWMAAGLLGPLTCGTALAQSVGWGASPGRASYRPEGQWNDGPFYTAPHVNPYLPHRAADNFLISADPSSFPYSTAPRGHYDAYTPGKGPVFPYAEGFSPYSGYADWFKKTYNFEPTRAQLERAVSMYFRSGGPRVGVIDPARAASPSPAQTAPKQPRPVLPSRGQRFRAESATGGSGTAVSEPHAPRIKIYRGTPGD